MDNTDSLALVVAIASPASLILLWGVGSRAGVALGMAVMTNHSLTVTIRWMTGVMP